MSHPFDRHLTSQAIEPSAWLRICCLLILVAATPATAQCNSAPVASDDTVDHTGDPIIIHVLANDEDLDGDPLEIVLGVENCSGEVTEDFGAILLTPNINSSESCTINYQILDGRGGMDSAAVTVLTTHLLFKDSFETGDTTRWVEEEAR